MINLFSWIIIPCITILMPGKSNWLKSNFSVAGSQPPEQLFLILWGSVTGSFFYVFIRRTIGQASLFIRGDKERDLTECAVFLLLISVFLPYQPAEHHILSVLHVACAFVACALLYLILLLLDLKMYFHLPDAFRPLTVALLSVIPVSLLLFLWAGAMISSALEIYFTIFCCLWLRLFYFRVLSVKSSLQLKQGVQNASS